MPAGLPTPQDVMSQSIRAISIDTCIFQQNGYRFDSGILAVLARQLPPWIQLVITDVVSREIDNHVVTNVRESYSRLKASTAEVKRHTGLDVSKIEEAIGSLNVEAEAQHLHRTKRDQFLQTFNPGKIIKTYQVVIANVLDYYFEGRPPFSVSKDKKHEFPDAISLFALEDYARDTHTNLIAVSNDRGWREYAEKSERIYCAETLDDLTSLFVADPKIAQQAEERIVRALDNPSSFLYKVVSDALDDELGNLSWSVDAYSNMADHADADVAGVSVISFDPDMDSIRVWISDKDQDVCVAEIEVSVDAKIEITANLKKWDGIDREYLPMGSGSKAIEDSVEVTAFISLSNFKAADPEEWEIGVWLSQGLLSVDAGEISPDWSADDPEG